MVWTSPQTKNKSYSCSRSSWSATWPTPPSWSRSCTTWYSSPCARSTPSRRERWGVFETLLLFLLLLILLRLRLFQALLFLLLNFRTRFLLYSTERGLHWLKNRHLSVLFSVYVETLNNGELKEKTFLRSPRTSTRPSSSGSPCTRPASSGWPSCRYTSGRETRSRQGDFRDAE